MDDASIQRELNMEVVRREMYRKSRDLIRVYNPLDFPFKFMYDAFWHTIPAGKTKDIERYLASHYFKKISEYMIGQQALVKGEELIDRRRKQGMPEFLNKYDENKAVWDNTPRQNDPELLKEIADIVVLGLVEEYGLELPDDAPVAQSGPDLRDLHEQIFAGMDKKHAPREEIEQAPVKPLKKALAEEMTSE